jgi:hypothetical protein
MAHFSDRIMPSIELIADSAGRNVKGRISQFSFSLSPPIEIPDNATNIALYVPSATIWFTTPNVVEGKTDRIIVIDNMAQTFTLTIEQGLYSVAQLNTYIQNALNQLGAVPNTVLISENSATNKIVLAIAPGASVNFPDPRGLHSILGFTAGTFVSPGATSSLQPQINPVDSYLIHSSLCAQGIRINNAYSSAIAQVLVNVVPGEQIHYSPRFPFRLECPTLVGITSNIDMWLTDTQNRIVDTAGEPWTARIVIEYTLS